MNRMQCLFSSLFTIAVCVLAVPGAALLSSETDSRPVKVSFIADHATISDGEELWLGVLFDIDSGWHIYWENPGETGFATRVEWDANQVTTHTLTSLYPAPLRFIGAGNILSYGYAGQTLIMARIPSVKIAPDTTMISLHAKVRWLMCREDECRDGRQTVELQLPVGKSAPANSQLFEHYRGLLPKSHPASNVKINILSKDAPRAVLEVKLPEGVEGILADDGTDTRGLYFYPRPHDQISSWKVSVDGSPETIKTAAGSLKVFRQPTTITVEMRLAGKGATTPFQAEGVLVQQWVNKDGKLTPVDATLVPIPVETVK